MPLPHVDLPGFIPLFTKASQRAHSSTERSMGGAIYRLSLFYKRLSLLSLTQAMPDDGRSCSRPYALA
jgi:hypothetical protein